MKVLILANFDVGLYQFRKELIEELLKKNEVFISLPYGDLVEPLKKLGCKFIDTPVDRRGVNPFKDFSLLYKYIKLLKYEKPDIVITYTIKPNVYGGLACQFTHMPYIANVTGFGTALENGGVMQLLTTNLYKLGLRKACCVFFQNSSNRQLFKVKKIVRRHTRLIPGSGVNLDNHCFEEYPQADRGIRFLFVGRLMKDKGIEELIAAMDLIHKEYPDISLDIVGDYDEDYSSLIDSVVSKGYVRYHGRQENVHEFYKNCHCVVLPSYHEGMANVLLEGASTGRPVIASDIPGCKETFEEGKTGFGCKAKSAESLVNAMKKFIVLSHEDKTQMGLSGRKKVKKEFDRSIIINAYLNEINELVKE